MLHALMWDVGCEMRDLGYGGCLQILRRNQHTHRDSMATGVPYDDILEGLQEATKAGDLLGVQQQFDKLQPSMMNPMYYQDPAASHQGNLRDLLNDAATSGHKSLVQYFLDVGAPLEGWMGGFCIEFCDKDPIEILTIYLQHGWDINTDGTEGTALMYVLHLLS